MTKKSFVALFYLFCIKDHQLGPDLSWSLKWDSSTTTHISRTFLTLAKKRSGSINFPRPQDWGIIRRLRVFLTPSLTSHFFYWTNMVTKLFIMPFREEHSKWIIAPNNFRVTPFPDPIKSFGPPGGHLDFASGVVFQAVRCCRRWTSAPGAARLVFLLILFNGLMSKKRYYIKK